MEWQMKEHYTFEEWKEIYNPFQNSDGDTKLFGTTGQDLKLMRELIPNQNIWTLVDAGDDEEGFETEILIAGFHIVNREGYVITFEKWEDCRIVADW